MLRGQEIGGVRVARTPLKNGLQSRPHACWHRPQRWPTQKALPCQDSHTSSLPISLIAKGNPIAGIRPLLPQPAGNHISDLVHCGCVLDIDDIVLLTLRASNHAERHSDNPVLRHGDDRGSTNGATQMRPALNQVNRFVFRDAVGGNDLHGFAAAPMAGKAINRSPRRVPLRSNSTVRGRRRFSLTGQLHISVPAPALHPTISVSSPLQRQLSQFDRRVDVDRTSASTRRRLESFIKSYAFDSPHTSTDAAPVIAFTVVRAMTRASSLRSPGT